MKKTLSVVQATPFNELLTLINQSVNRELPVEEQDNQLKTTLSVYAEDLTPAKTRNIANYLTIRKVEIENAKNSKKDVVKYFDELIRSLESETESTKKYFSTQLYLNGYDTKNRLKSNDGQGIWYTTKDEVDDNKSSMMPPKYKKVEVHLPMELWSKIYDIAVQQLDLDNIDVKISLNKTLIHNDIKAGLLDKEFVKENIHLVVGKGE